MDFIYGLLVGAPLGAAGLFYALRFAAIKWPSHFDGTLAWLRGK